VPALSTVRPDFADIRAQFQGFLSAYESWHDTLISSTGQMEIDFVAGMAAYNQFGIERAVQEVFLETAVGDSSVYSIARLLGVKVARRIPAQVTAQFTSAGSLTIPPYTAFSVGPLSFYNRDAIILSGTDLVSVTLYEGALVTESYNGTGNPFQIVTTATPDFQGANSDVRVSVDGVPWEETPYGLWNAPTDGLVFYESTTQDGRIEVLFGDSVYGAEPPAGTNNVVVRYYATRGALANSASSGVAVSNAFAPSIAGVTTTAITQGQNVQGLSFYRYTVPRLYASGRRIVTRDDGKAIILTYPGFVVQDVNFIGERELGPGQVQFQNTAGAVVLAASPPSAAQVETFLAWLDTYKMSALNVLFINPIAVPADVHLDLIVDRNYLGASVMAEVTARLTAFFAPQIGTLGRAIWLSDLYKLVMETPGVVHCDVNQPSVNIFTNYKSYVTVNSITYDSVAYPDGTLITDLDSNLSVVQGRIILQPSVPYAVPVGVAVLDILLVGDGGRGGNSYDDLTFLRTGGGGAGGDVKRRDVAVDPAVQSTVTWHRDTLGRAVVVVSPGGDTFLCAAGGPGTDSVTGSPGVGGGGGQVSTVDDRSNPGSNPVSPEGVSGPGKGGYGGTSPTQNTPSQAGSPGECVVAWGTAVSTSVPYGDYGGTPGFNGFSVAEV
jgi:hypothetical protein